MHIVASYGIAERNIYREIKWVEDTLIQARTCSLSGRKAPLKSNMEYEVILVDATGSPIERPKKAKAILFRDEKWHTLKTQVLVDFKTLWLFKDSRAHVKAETTLETDTGYHEYAQIYASSLLAPKELQEPSVVQTETQRKP